MGAGVGVDFTHIAEAALTAAFVAGATIAVIKNRLGTVDKRLDKIDLVLEKLGRVDLLDERVMAQGKRFDEISQMQGKRLDEGLKRLNDYVDGQRDGSAKIQ